MQPPGVRRSQSSSHDDALTAYLREIRAYPLLTRDEEMALARRIRQGETEALDKLVCSNLRFVVSVAKKYQHQGVPLADLINEGNLGLMRAAEKFDDARDVKFISYAVWWIRQAILQALAELGHTVRVPLSRAGTLYRIGRQANVLRHELGREPTAQELAAGLDVDERDLAVALPVASPDVSLDAPLSTNEDGRLMDYLADDMSPAPDEDVLDHGLVDSIEDALAHLRGREAQVLRLYFGFDGSEPMTLESIGALLGITRERVGQIKDKAISRLRKSEVARALASFREK